MGLDYSYLLYFHRKDLWTVIQGLTDYCDAPELPTRIIFPNQVQEIALEAWCAQDNTFHHDADELGFVLSMRFPVDQAIYEWMLRLNNEGFVDPELADELQYGYVGCIYLTIRQNLLSEEGPKLPDEYVLFDFGTPGTSMSLLFDESIEIRNTFTDLLDNYNGVCGVFNREDNGEVFWFDGHQVNLPLNDPFLSIEEIKALLT